MKHNNKMKQLLTILSILLVCFSAQAATGNTYYVSFTGGNDNNTTTQAKKPATPWKTLSKINSLMSAGTIINGDSVLLKCGDTWTLDSLTVSKGININSYGTGAKPVISGFYTVAGWTSLGNGIYESEAMPTTAFVNSVTINGKMHAMGRFPNADASNGGYLTYEKGTTSFLIDNVNRPATVNNATWAGAIVVCRNNHFVINRATISSINTDTIKASFSSTPTANFGYFLENDIDALDQFGEWYYNPTTKKIAVFFGSSGPNGAVVQVSAKNVLLTPTASNTTINNITFQGSNTYCIWNWNSGVSGLSITNCNFYFAGVDAISLEQRANLIIKNCNINWCNGNGICMANNDRASIIDNNIISNIGQFPGMYQNINTSGGRYGIGICHIPGAGVPGMTCTNNKLTKIGGHGIFLYGDSMYIYNNIVDTFCNVMDDDGGIYTPNQALLRRAYVMILNNVVRNGLGAHFGTDGTTDFAEGIYLDDGSNGVTVSGNTSYNNASRGVYMHNARRCTITNNTLYNNAMQLAFIHGTQVSMTMDSNIVTHNVMFALKSSQLLQFRAKDGSFNENFKTYTLRCDSNIYCSPFSGEAAIIQTNWFGQGANCCATYDLNGWASATGFDTHTTKTPVGVTDPAKIIFRVNTSAAVSKDIHVCTSCIGVDGNTVTKKKTLSSFSSTILIKN